MAGVSVWWWVAGVVALLAVADQLLYRKRRAMVGAAEQASVCPFIGTMVESMYPKFDGYLKMWSAGPLSCTSVLGKFIVIAGNTALSRKIFSTPGYAKLTTIPAMKQLMTPESFIFQYGFKHQRVRYRLNPLFSKSGLASYLDKQEEIMQGFIDSWLAECKEQGPVEFQNRCRTLNMATSVGVFVGPYLKPGELEQISQAYYNMTDALQLVNFPLALPGTKLWKGVQGRKLIMRVFTRCIGSAIEAMSQPGAQPRCMADRVVLGPGGPLYDPSQDENKQEEEKEDKKDKEEVRFTNEEMGNFLMVFIFASQDASTSSLVWTMTLLSQYPEVKEKIAAEHQRLRPNGEPFTYDLVEQMNYTRQVVKEVLRFRPPVTMVPHMAAKDWEIQPGSVIPKDTLIIGSIWPSHFEEGGFKDPYKFDPDRFGPERDEGTTCAKYWMTFGVGPHACLGYQYAINQLILFAAMLCAQCDIKRVRTPVSDKIKVFCTIYPGDGLKALLTRRRVDKVE
eukprot:jgi/Chlat1/1350/Chrsp119S01762